MSRKRMSNNKKVALPMLNPDAAGIDIGATGIYVAMPPDRDPEPVRMFASFAEDLNALADWLQQCGVGTVAMESTGVYWIPLRADFGDPRSRSPGYVFDVPGKSKAASQ